MYPVLADSATCPVKACRGVLCNSICAQRHYVTGNDKMFWDSNNTHKDVTSHQVKKHGVVI